MNEGIDRMIADLETPVVRQGWTVRILKGTGLALWALLLLVCYNFGVMRVAEWAEERFGTPPWPFVVVFGPLLLPLFIVRLPFAALGPGTQWVAVLLLCALYAIKHFSRN